MSILDTLEINNFFVLGSLTGCSPALALAVKYPERVLQVILGMPFYFFPDTLSRSKVYRERLRNFSPDSSGNAALAAWQNYNMRPLTLGSSEEIWLNYRKTLDTWRAMPFQWQYVQANHDFIETGEFLEALRSVGARRVLIIWSPHFEKLMTRFGLRAAESRTLIENTLKSGGVEFVVRESSGANQQGLGEAIFGEDAANISQWILQFLADQRQ